jgi:hypothetical protein
VLLEDLADEFELSDTVALLQWVPCGTSSPWKRGTSRSPTLSWRYSIRRAVRPLILLTRGACVSATYRQSAGSQSRDSLCVSRSRSSNPVGATHERRGAGNTPAKDAIDYLLPASSNRSETLGPPPDQNIQIHPPSIITTFRIGRRADTARRTHLF